MRRTVVVFLTTCIAALSGVAAASVLGATSSAQPSVEASVEPSEAPSASASVEQGQSEAQQPPEAEHERNEKAEGVHGGTIQRFASSAACDLVAVNALPGNWTHGDYVNAVSTGGAAPAVVTQAAHSDCGKPMVAVGHGGGPPEHALANMAAGQAHAGSGSG